jgi:hypothetical protein
LRRFARGAFLVLLTPALGGCQLFSALSQSVGSLLAIAISLAIIAAPFVLAYYLYKK